MLAAVSQKECLKCLLKITGSENNKTCYSSSQPHTPLTHTHTRALLGVCVCGMLLPGFSEQGLASSSAGPRLFTASSGRSAKKRRSRRKQKNPLATKRSSTRKIARGNGVKKTRRKTGAGARKKRSLKKRTVGKAIFGGVKKRKNKSRRKKAKKNGRSTQRIVRL